MPSSSLTWLGGTETQVTADASINSDPQNIDGLFGWSLIVLVAGSAPSGISGNLAIEVTNDPAGLTGWTLLDGSVQSVEVDSGATEPIRWSYIGSEFFVWARLQWVQAGAPDSGELGIGTWGLFPQAVVPVPPPPAQPNPPPVNPGVVVAPLDRFRQYLKTKANVRATVSTFVSRFAEAGQAIQAIQAARSWAALATGNYTDMLNQIGSLVGATRPGGSSDQMYVQYVKAQIAANQSSGRIEDMYGIASLICPAGVTLRIDDYPPAGFVLTVGDPLGLLGPNGAGWTEPFVSAAGADGAGYDPPYGDGNSGSHTIDAISYFFERAKPAAVWQVVQYGLSPTAGLFTFDSGPGFDVGKLAGWQGP